MKSGKAWPLVSAVLLIGLLSALIWANYSASTTYRRQLLAALSDLRRAQGTALTDEKTRQEAIKLRLENEQRAAFLQAVLAAIGASVGMAVAVAGIWVGFAQYMAGRERDRLDRASKDLEQLWKGISESHNPNVQAAAIAALQHFLSPDKKDYHERVAAALAVAGRMTERDEIVDRTLTPLVQRAMRQITTSMRGVSWQGLHLKSLDLSGIDLSHFDFRDSVLEEAIFDGCLLRGARFDAARLVRSRFRRADLSGASLEYADLADADLEGAQLRGANLRHMRLMNMGITNADLTDAALLHDEAAWRLAAGWRSAAFSPGVKERLLALHGPPASGPRVLMLLWEFFPHVSGGAWTAAHHLLRRLRRSGADIVVAVPLSASDVSREEFGNEVPLLALGDDNIANIGRYTTYGERGHRRVAAATNRQYESSVSGMEWFAQKLVEVIDQRDLAFDIVHAHDWITFHAASAAAARLRCPWVAHFHSCERDRRADTPNAGIVDIEREACATAAAIVVPSHATESRLIEEYAAVPERVRVIPNVLSEGGAITHIPSENFANRRVVFVGRLSKQKGPDRFVQMAHSVRAKMPACTFTVYGSGEMDESLKQLARAPDSVVVPPPEEVAATDTDSFERAALPVEIGDIATAVFDVAERRILSVQSEKVGKQKEKLVDVVLSRGFTAYGVEHAAYTHVIEVKGEVGAGQFAIKAKGLRAVERIPAAAVVGFEGWMPWKLRANAFRRASVVVVPSRAEPFGMVVLEAMEQGIPVMFEGTAGVGEVLRSGIRVDSSAPDAVGENLLLLLQREDSWREAAWAGLQEAMEYPNRGYERALSALWKELAVRSERGKPSEVR